MTKTINANYGIDINMIIVNNLNIGNSPEQCQIEESSIEQKFRKSK